MTKTKVCPKCGIRKFRTAYSKNKSKTAGHDSKCKACRRKYFNKKFKEKYKSAAWRRQKIVRVLKSQRKRFKQGICISCTNMRKPNRIRCQPCTNLQAETRRRVMKYRLGITKYLFHHRLINPSDRMCQ